MPLPLHPPGWRPGFKFYNKWVSLFAAILCLVIMFIISWWTALITIVLVLALYAYVWYKKPDVNWGSYGQAFWFKQAMLSLRKLELTTSHIKNYRWEGGARGLHWQHGRSKAYFSADCCMNDKHSG